MNNSRINKNFKSNNILSLSLIDNWCR
jgi:hypothetical protein